MKQDREIFPEDIEDYKVRSLGNRFGTFSKATMDLMKHYMGKGDDYNLAKNKVAELAKEISDNKPSAKFDYVIGVTQPLIDQVNASALPHMTQEEKDLVTNILTNG